MAWWAGMYPFSRLGSWRRGWAAVALWILLFVQLPVSGSVLVVSKATWHFTELLRLVGPETLHF